MPIKISRHCSAVIVKSSDNNLFLFSQYDHTYPFKDFRGYINLIGGGRDIKKDNSPRETLEREINEEFSNIIDENTDNFLYSLVGEYHNSAKIKQFSKTKEIFFIRDSILEEISPYKDFLIKIPPMGKLKTPFFVIHSVFVSTISPDIFQEVYKNNNRKRRVVNEGLIKIINKKDLINGKFKTIFGVSYIMADFLEKKVPLSIEIFTVPIGLTKNSFKEYEKNFIYI